VIQVTDEPIDAQAVLAAVESPRAGAGLLFLGVVRDHNDGRRVRFLEYEAYQPMAERSLRELVASLEAEFGPGLGVAIVHRVGRLEIGEASVAIAVSSAHRDAAYRASRAAIERLKRDVPIWKKEHFLGGAVWVEGPGPPPAKPA